MTISVRSEAEGGGRVVAVKTALGEADADTLAHEAGMLELARHPGVVELLEFHRGPDQAELRTPQAGIHSLATIGPLPVEQVAGVVAAVATTLADLHELGIVHGRLEPAHVIIGPAGRPLLCGFRGAGLADEPGQAGERLSPADDVLSLGLLLRDLVTGGRDSGDADPIPERRSLRPWRRGSWTGYHRRSLLTLADRASADEPRMRGTARALAAAIQDAVPTAALPAPADPGTVLPLLAPEPDRHLAADDVVTGPGSVGRRRLLAAGAMAIAPLAALLFYGVRSARSGAPPAAIDGIRASDGQQRSDTALPAVPDVSSTTLRAGCEPPILDPGDISADVDGDGCPDTVRITDGVVEVRGTRWAVGRPGDQLLVGDWDCDGLATVALVRPSSGQVFVFGGWADATADLVATPVPGVAGALAGRIEDDDGDGCAVLVIAQAGGAESRVEALS